MSKNEIPCNLHKCQILITEELIQKTLLNELSHKKRVGNYKLSIKIMGNEKNTVRRTIIMTTAFKLAKGYGIKIIWKKGRNYFALAP